MALKMKRIMYKHMQHLKHSIVCKLPQQSHKLTHPVAVGNERQCVTVHRSYCRSHPIHQQHNATVTEVSWILFSNANIGTTSSKHEFNTEACNRADRCRLQAFEMWTKSAGRTRRLTKTLHVLFKKIGR